MTTINDPDNKPLYIRLDDPRYNGLQVITGLPEAFRTKVAPEAKQAPAPAPQPMPTTETVRDQVTVSGVTLKAYTFGRVSFVTDGQPEVRLGNDPHDWMRKLIAALQAGSEVPR